MAASIANADLSMSAVRHSDLRIFLVRHGESEANIDKSVFQRKPDHAMELTPSGVEMAKQAGLHIRNALRTAYGDKDAIRASHHVRMWVSPFTRTRQTADAVLSVLNEGIVNAADGPSPRGDVWVDDVRETPLLAEQDFGVFESSHVSKHAHDAEQPSSHHVTNTARDEIKPDAVVAPVVAPAASSPTTAVYASEKARNSLKERYAGQFWVRPPQGESMFDVSVRLATVIHEVVRDVLIPDTERPPVRVVVIVSHGNTIREFVRSWCRYSPEWLAVAPAPPNCSVQVLRGRDYAGYLFPGFRKGKATLEIVGQEELPSVPDPRANAWISKLPSPQRRPGEDAEKK